MAATCERIAYEAVRLQVGDKGVEAVADMLAKVRGVPLANHEEPFTSFIPYRRED